jgi:hypothetical protein
MRVAHTGERAAHARLDALLDCARPAVLGEQISKFSIACSLSSRTPSLSTMTSRDLWKTTRRADVGADRAHSTLSESRSTALDSSGSQGQPPLSSAPPRAFAHTCLGKSEEGLQHGQARTIRKEGQGGPPTCLNRHKIKCCTCHKVADDRRLAAAHCVGATTEPL